MQRHPYEWPSLAENQWPNHGRKLTVEKQHPGRLLMPGVSPGSTDQQRTIPCSYRACPPAALTNNAQSLALAGRVAPLAPNYRSSRPNAGAARPL